MASSANANSPSVILNSIEDPHTSGSAPTLNSAKTKSRRMSDVWCQTQKKKAFANAGSPIGVGDDVVL